MPRLYLPLLLLSAAASQALEIRAYAPSRHDRFVTDGSTTLPNPSAYYPAASYAGIAFGANPADTRQFALVTPEHVVFARHYSFGGGIRFINADGVAVDRTLGATIEIPNGTGGISDLILFRLSAPVTPADGIQPFPYLNLESEAAYNNIVLTTFGQTLRAGRGRISSFGNYSESGIDQTRTVRFSYNRNSGNQDDAYFVVGDSGSPTFAMVNGRPALVGVHLAVSSGPASTTNIDTFVPHYAATVNGLLAPEGYQLIPVYPPPVALTLSMNGPPLRQAYPGTLELDLANGSANTATNLRLDLSFPANAVPSSLAAPGWIVENPAPGEYRLRRATLAGGAAAAATVSYDSVPLVPEITISMTHRSDGSPELNPMFTLPVRETFAGFVADLPLKGETDDPDEDGFGNLIEYAFGGDPADASSVTPQGISLAPEVRLSGGELRYTFPRRTDAAERGLTYGIRFSETLEEGSFSATPPPGFSVSAAAYSPAVIGFEKVTATLPVSLEKLFLRVEIGLAE